LRATEQEVKLDCHQFALTVIIAASNHNSDVTQWHQHRRSNTAGLVLHSLFDLIGTDLKMANSEGIVVLSNYCSKFCHICDV
jgi:hypothetical protein